MFSRLQRTATQCIIYDEEWNVAFRSPGYQEFHFISLRTIESKASSALKSLMELTEMDAHPDINSDPLLCTNVAQLTVYQRSWHSRIGVNVYSFRLLNCWPECGESLILKKRRQTMELSLLALTKSTCPMRCERINQRLWSSRLLQFPTLDADRHGSNKLTP
jgi:hypothetical protein